MVLFVYVGPIVGLAAIGLVLFLGERMLSRVAGFVIVAASVAWMIGLAVWVGRACYDVGEIPGCDGLENYLVPTWFVSVAVCVIALAVGIVRLVLGSRSHRISSH